MKRTVILGGGTFEPIRNHLSLSAPAFGTTAIKLSELIENSELVLTKMADRSSKLVTNTDVEKYIDTLLDDENVGTIVLNVAFCDFKSTPIDGVECGLHADRLKTMDGNLSIELTPTDKVISKIRIKRPDIFLIGFKTTTNKTSDEQFLIALKMMKSTKCNLVLANDTVTRNNMVITPEETIYHETTDRSEVLNGLTEIIKLRSNLTYNATEFIKTEETFNIFDGDDSTAHYKTDSFKTVLKYVIDNGGFIENNGNGFTPGHFCFRLEDNEFISSQRKANHNLVEKEGMSVVLAYCEPDKNSDADFKFKVRGTRKASVGARSQWMLLKENPDYDCIIHTHNPLKPGSKIPVAEQRPFQCGSLECGLNTVNNMSDFGDIKAVYLDKHGANILFKSGSDPYVVIEFIKNNIELGTKVK